MGGEGQEDDGKAGGFGFPGKAADDPPVAPVEAVEIADGHGQAPPGRSDGVQRPEDAHRLRA